MPTMMKQARVSKGEPRFFCFDPGDERYNPLTSYFDDGGWGAKGFHDFPVEYDRPFTMPPDWPGNEPVWAAYCGSCAWRYEGPQSKAIGKFINHCAVGTAHEHRLTYIHLGTCWHTFDPENPLQYIHCQNHALEMIKQAGRSYRKRCQFNDSVPMPSGTLIGVRK